jgi:hypothetical protein
VGEAEPTLSKAFNPWDEMTTPEALAALFVGPGCHRLPWSRSLRKGGGLTHQGTHGRHYASVVTASAGTVTAFGTTTGSSAALPPGHQLHYRRVISCITTGSSAALTKALRQSSAG